LKLRLFVSFVYDVEEEGLSIKANMLGLCEVFLNLDVSNYQNSSIENINAIVLPNFTTYEDFKSISDDGRLKGELPEKTDKVSHRRLGVTGLAKHEDNLLLGCWNGIYVLDRTSLGFKYFISHRLTNDIHGFYVYNNKIITSLPCKDTIVITDFGGNLIDYFSIDDSINYVKDTSLSKTDWRFVAKNQRGSCGVFHFNYIQKIGNELWITCRNINSFIVFLLCHIL